MISKEQMKQIGLNLGAVLIGCMVFFLILEIIVRVVPLEEEVFITLDPCVGHINKPRISGEHVFADGHNFVSFNFKGFHDTEHYIDAKPGTFRIAVLGDSFVEGLQVPTNSVISKVLEKDLKDKNLPVEVLSFGISSYGTDQELMMYRCIARLYKPDLVLLNFSANDSGDNYFKKSPYKPEFSLDEKGQLTLDQTYVSNIEKRIAERTSFSFEGITFWIKEHSYAARFIKRKLDIISSTINVTDDKESPRNTVALLNRKDDAEQEKAWRLTEKLLEELQKEVRSDGAKFVLVKIPGQPELPGELEKMGVSPKDYDADKARKRLSDMATKLNMQYLDLQDAMINGGGFSKLYFPLDRHWKKEGNATAANALTSFIIKNNLLQ